MQIKSVNGISEVPLVYLKKIKINDEVYNDLYKENINLVMITMYYLM